MGCNPSKDGGGEGTANADEHVPPKTSASTPAGNGAETLFIPLSDGELFFLSSRPTCADPHGLTNAAALSQLLLRVSRGSENAFFELRLLRGSAVTAAPASLLR